MKRLTGRRMYLVGLAAAALALVVLARFAPTVALSLSLALPATEASLARVFPDPVREEIVLSAGSRTIQADLYRPGTPRAALLAAAAYPEIALVGSFGGYADLQNVIAYVTTGVHTFGGRRYVQPQEEYIRWKLLALLVGFVASERDRTLLGAIARRKLENPGV